MADTIFSTIIEAADVRDLLESGAAPLIFDCRHELSDLQAGREAYLAGHLPGAHHLHLDEDLSGPIRPGVTGRHPLPDMDNFARRMTALGLGPGTQVVVYDDKGGGIAARAWWMLRHLGHEAVAVLNGGIAAWTAAGGRLEAGDRPLPTAGTEIAGHLAPGGILGTRARAQINRLRHDPEWTLVDSRTTPRYRGEAEPIDPVAGHIGGAINLPWPDNLEDGKLRQPEALRARFAPLDRGADHTVFYCGSGVTACHNILAYTVAFGDIPLLYPGSWSDWITDPEAEVSTVVE
ncbi:sulfurtransferase [Lewinella sp. W8]|uniref:sulfurtransferase n=1 Tax=Lewinella sp. W8 TaxID=2528208 RepID=UPI0010671D6C|nr:sulfurtransferase [Lewinella sp. W8]MTB52421.1 sulfurtransferase [Lewinella sp. W8]